MAAYPYAHQPMKTRRNDWRKFSHLIFSRLLPALILVMGLLGTYTPTQALGAGDLTVFFGTPFATLDSNKPCESGPMAMYIELEVTNPAGGSAGDLNGVSITLSNFNNANFTFDAGESQTRYIGTILDGQTRHLWWFVNYACVHAVSSTFTATISDSNPGTQTYGPYTITTRSEISASAGGDLVSQTIGGPGYSLGQVIPMTVVYSFGNVGSNQDVIIQPAGNISHNGGCFRLIGVDVTGFPNGSLTGITVNDDNDLYFTGVSSTGQGNEMSVDYYFQYMCAGTSSVLQPFADMGSGTQYKYTGNFPFCSTGAVCTMPAGSNPFTITKSANPTSLPGGGTVTYTVTIENTSAYPAYIDRITDVLPASVSYIGIAGGSQVTAANSSSVPVGGATGPITWVGIPVSNCVGGTCAGSYLVPGNGTLTLVYTATIPAAFGGYTNSVTAQAGNVTIGPARSTVMTGTPPTITKAFNLATINIGQTSLLTITLNNTNGTALTGAAFTDTLPDGMTTVAATASSTHPGGCGGTASQTANTVSLSGGTIPAGGSCTVTVTVTTNNSGPFLNTIPASALTTTQGFTNVAPATATLTVIGMTVTKTSNAPGGFVSPGDTITYTIRIENPGALQTNVVVTDQPVAGTTYVNNSTQAVGYALTANQYYGDTFSAVSYGNNNNSTGLTWTNNWAEGGAEAGNNPAAGDIVVTTAAQGSRLRFNGNAAVETLTRTANLKDATTATLAFRCYPTANLEDGDIFLVQMWNINTSAWDTLDNFNWPTAANCDNSGAGYSRTLGAAYIGANTQLRFSVQGFTGNGANEYMELDNVRITFTGPTAITKDNIAGGTYLDLGNGTPPNLVEAADAFVIPSGVPGTPGVMTVTYQVRADTLGAGQTTVTNTVNVTSTQTPSPGVTDTVTDTVKGRIVVDKITVPTGDAQSFTFTTTGAGYTGFSLTDAAAPNSQYLVPGTYSVAETVPAGWDLTSATCDDGSPITAIVLSAAETVTCTFTNTRRSTIIVDKVTVPAGDPQSFDFTGTGPGYNDFSLTDAAAPNSQDLAPGTYSVAETVPAGWDLTSATCSDGSPITAIDLSAGETITCTFTNTKRSHIIVDKVTNPAGDVQSFTFTTTGTGYTGFSLTDAAAPNDQELVAGAYSVAETVPTGWNLTNTTCVSSIGDTETAGNLELDAGETITCTFTNTKRGHIIVDKVTNPAGDAQSFTFTTTGAGYTGFSLTDAAAPNDQELAPGAYSVAETVPGGWNLTNTACVSSIGDTETAGNLELDAGETITCTFTNTKGSTIVVDKVTNPAGAAQSFTFTTTGTGYTGFSLTDAAAPNSQALAPGAYSVAETVPGGWNLTNTTCVSSIGDTETAANLELDAGETITCTFTNTAVLTINAGKSANPTSVPETGQSVIYTVTVENTSSVPLTLDTLDDDLFNDITTTGHDGITATTCATGGTIAAATTYTCTFTATVAGDFPGSHVNTVTANVSNGTLTATDTATATVTFTDVLPDITVTKTAQGAPASVPETGGNVTFTYMVTNNSTEAATITALNDDQFGVLAGDADCQVGTVLAGSGGNCSFDATFAIPAGDFPGTHVNTFSATVTDGDGNNDTATDDETVTYTDVLPDITATKTANPTVVPEAGGPVVYTIVVTNNSAEAATLDGLTDDLFGNITTTGHDGITATTCATGGTIAANGGTYTCTFTATVSGTAGVDHVNTVTAQASDGDGNTDTATDTATVSFTTAPVLSFNLTKTADDNSIPETGQAVTFTVNILNTGNLDATLDSLTDSVFNNITTTGHDGITATTCATGGTIVASGGTYACTFTATVSGDFGGPAHVNTLTAQVSNGATTASDTDDETITFEDVLPTVGVTKTADPTILLEPGGSVVFTVTVQNTGIESVVVTSLTDTIFNDITTTGHDGITATTCGTGAVLLGGNTYTCTFTAVITGNAGVIHVDEVTGTVSDNDGNTANGTDDATVTITDVASSAILTKTAEPTSVLEPGADVTFTVLVDNTSAADVLTLTALSDDVYGDIADGANPNLVSTTCVVPQTINPGGFYTCTFVAYVGGVDGTVVTDTVTATLTDNDNNTLTPSDDATVDVVGALIGVAKRVVGAPVETSAGVYRVTYEILVQNYGSVALMNLEVTDDLSITFPLPNTFTVVNLTSADFTENWPGYDGNGITGDINLLAGIDTLAAGASGKITLVVDVTPAEVGPFDNTAIASGLTPAERRVTDRSQDGIDPDPDDDGNPTNDNDPTPVSFGLFDPPFGVKSVDASGKPVLKWTMVWINNSNIVAVNAAVHDPIPVGTVYVAGSVSCTDTSAITVTTNCSYEAPTGPYPLGRIVWEGTLGPDFGVTDPAVAVNDITISFSVTVASGVTSVSNLATIDSDLNGDGDTTDNGEQQVARASATWQEQEVQPELPQEQPATGFAPGRVTEIGSAPAGAYEASGDLRLVIPKLRVSLPIVGVPLQDGGWDVTWLWKQAGWLEGTAYPTLSGNSVLTAHVYDANGLPGPFVNLGSLKWGDRIIVKMNGMQYIYEVRTNEVVSPNNMNAFKHEEKAWLTLITCKQYDEATNAYKKRVVVRAVLVDVLPGESTSGR